MISVHIANKRKNAKDNKDIDTKKLFLNYLSIIRIDLVPVEYTWVSELHLNHNMLRSLSGIEQFKNLRVLQLKFNFLTHISELNKVVNKHLLVDLNIKGNPVISRADPYLTLDYMKQNLFENLKSFNQDDFQQDYLKKPDIQLKVDESNLMKEHLKSQMRKDTFEEIKAKQIQCAEEISVAISFQREQSLQNIAKLQKHTNIVQQNLSSLQKNIQQQQLLEHFFSKIVPDTQSIQQKIRAPQGVLGPTTPQGKTIDFKIQKTPREVSYLNGKLNEKETKRTTNSFLSSKDEPKSYLKTLVQQIIPESKVQFERSISLHKRDTTPRQKLSCEQYLVQKGGTQQSSQETKQKNVISDNQKEKYLLKRRNVDEIQTAKYSSMRLDFSPMSQRSAGGVHSESFRAPSASSNLYPQSTSNRLNKCNIQYQSQQNSINRQPSKSVHNSFLNHSDVQSLINQSQYEIEGCKQNDKIHNYSSTTSHNVSGFKSQNGLSINDKNIRKPFAQVNLQRSQLKNSFVVGEEKEDTQRRSSSVQQFKQNQASTFETRDLNLKDESSFLQNSKNYLTPRIRGKEIENIPPLIDNWQIQNNSSLVLSQRKGNNNNSNKSAILDQSPLNPSPFRSNRDQIQGYQVHNVNNKGKSLNQSMERFGSANNKSAIRIQEQFKMIDKSLDCTELVSQENYTTSTDQRQNIEMSQENIETENTVCNQSVQLRPNLFQFQRLNTFNQIELGPYEEDSLPTCRRNKQQSIIHGLQEQECKNTLLPNQYLNQKQNLEIQSQRLVDKHIDDIDNDIDELAKKYYRGILLNKVFRVFKEFKNESTRHFIKSEEKLFYRKALCVKAFYSWKSYLASEKNAREAHRVINLMRNKNRF